MWHMRSPRIASPGCVCALIAILLHIVPEGRNRPASLPSIEAVISSSLMTVGSCRRCSSPTSASAMARRMSFVGSVWVSQERLIIISLDFQHQPRRILMQFFHPYEEADRFATVDQAVVVAQCDVHHRADFDLAGDPDRALL